MRARAATLARGVRLLWEVCQIPDFRKTLTDGAPASAGARCSATWRAPRPCCRPTGSADQIARLERTDGDIEPLVARIAQIRTWTYIAHRADWLRDAGALAGAHARGRGPAVAMRCTSA